RAQSRRAVPPLPEKRLSARASRLPQQGRAGRRGRGRPRVAARNGRGVDAAESSIHRRATCDASRTRDHCMTSWIEGEPQRIVVFRALMLGDLLCAVPALRALKHGFPSAEITLVGLPWARPLAQRIAHVDDFMPFPGHPGLPEGPCDVRALPDFL